MSLQLKEIPLFKFDKFYVNLTDGTSEDMQAAISKLLKDHADWSATIDLKWEKKVYNVEANSNINS